MSGLDRDDLRAAVATGLISDAQAAGLMTLAAARAQGRAEPGGLDEPFELFRGFNEIFIVVGLGILAAGYFGVTALSPFSDGPGLIWKTAASIFGLVGVLGLSNYFTRKRRMVAPSILLSLFTLYLAGSLGTAIASMAGWDTHAATLAAGVSSATLLSAHYARFRVPFSAALIAVSIFFSAFAFLGLQGAEGQGFGAIFLLNAGGPYAYVTFVLGLACLAVALRLDLSDPHRVTRRAATAFWLHVVAAPAIVNTVAMTLFSMEGAGPQLALMGFIGLMAVLAVVIDRRSFLISGVGYAVALAVSINEGSAALIVLLLGLGLVLLGAQWERLRRALMNGLPDFPGKSRLPPWTHQTDKEPNA